jgi:hypothetical protein
MFIQDSSTIHAKEHIFKRQTVEKMTSRVSGKLNTQKCFYVEQ